MKGKLRDKDEVVRLMRDGWQFGWSYGSGREAGRYWLQKPALMCGGESIEVHATTGRSLSKAGIIKVAKREKDPFWLQRYELTKP